MTDCRTNSKESYTGTQGIFDRNDQVQQLYSPCEECSSIYQAKKIRTPYDQFWINYYNHKAQSNVTNLLDLQFLS